MDLIRGSINKFYGWKEVFAYANILIETGEIYLVVGRNGVGKSTLLRILAKIEEPKLKNHQVSVYDISYMPNQLTYYKHMKVKDLLSFYHDTNERFSIEEAKKHLKHFEVNQDIKIKHLSDGQVKILAFVICLSFDATLYLIDEPFPNVDLINDEYFRKMILERYDEHTTFVIATHQINELEKVASKCLFIKDINTIEQFDVDELRSERSQSVESYFKERLKC